MGAVGPLSASHPRLELNFRDQWCEKIHNCEGLVGYVMCRKMYSVIKMFQVLYWQLMNGPNCCKCATTIHHNNLQLPLLMGNFADWKISQCARLHGWAELQFPWFHGNSSNVRAQRQTSAQSEAHFDSLSLSHSASVNPVRVGYLLSVHLMESVDQQHTVSSVLLDHAAAAVS